MDEIKKRIRQLRKERGLTMAEFGKAVGASPGNVGDWESSKRPSVPGAQTLICISKAYNVSIDWILLGGKRYTEEQYSEHIKSQYAADAVVFERIMELAIRLDKAELQMLLDYVKNLHNKPHDTSAL